MGEALDPGQLDGEGSPEIGVDDPGTVCGGDCQGDEAGTSRHPIAAGLWGRQETVRQLVRVGASDAGRN